MCGCLKKRQPLTCLIFKVDVTKPRHQKLGHINNKSMRTIIFEDAIKRLLKLKIEEGTIYGECQIGKRAKMSHKKLRHLTTLKVLELLHMDLTGLMPVERLVRKIYVLICVDDFSRYT